MTIDLGFIGTGGIAAHHLDTVAARDDATVAAICDVDPGVATDVGDRYDATTYTDHHDLYAEETLDAVVVAVPPFAHEDQERLAAERGLDLFVEKPLALDGETARENEAAIEEAGVLSQVGHMCRYSAAVQRAKELIDDRTVALIDGHWWCGVPGTPWWRVKGQSGGQVVEMATHTYDLVRYFGGDVAEVHAYGGQRVVTDDIDFEDSTSAVMQHENGVTSHVSASSASPSGDRRIHLVGDGFQLEVSAESDTLTGVVDGEAVDFEGPGDLWRREMDAFVDAVRTRDESLLRSPYPDGRKTFETTLAVEESLQTGDPCEVGE